MDYGIIGLLEAKPNNSPLLLENSREFLNGKVALPKPGISSSELYKNWDWHQKWQFVYL